MESMNSARPWHQTITVTDRLGAAPPPGRRPSLLRLHIGIPGKPRP
jgi:hypothetical protein